jgi:hypothetical protein
MSIRRSSYIHFNGLIIATNDFVLKVGFADQSPSIDVKSDHARSTNLMTVKPRTGVEDSENQLGFFLSAS